MTASDPVAKAIKPDPLVAWENKLQTTMAILSQPGKHIVPPPADLPLDALAGLMEVRQHFAINDNSERPSRDFAAEISSRWAGETRKAELGDLMSGMVDAIDDRVAKLLDSGAKDSRLIRSVDFGAGLYRMNPTGPHQIGLWCGAVESLPVGHPAASLLPSDGLYRVTTPTGNKLCVILGPGRAGVRDTPPRPWYLAQRTLELTRQFRAYQSREDVEKAEREKFYSEQAARDFWNSELGQHERLNRALKQLAELGRIPAETTEMLTADKPDGAK